MNIFNRGAADQTDAGRPKKENKTKKRGSVKKWLRELRSELKKVVWPTRSQVVNNTWVVLVCIVVVGIALWIFDYIAGEFVNFLINVVS